MQAQCSRTMNVPIAPIRFSVIFGAGDEVSGVYPEVLRNMEARDGCSFKFSLVPLIYSRAVLVSVASERTLMLRVRDVLERVGARPNFPSIHE